MRAEADSSGSYRSSLRSILIAGEADRFLARNGPAGPVWRCPLIGVDRKWLAEGPTRLTR